MRVRIVQQPLNQELYIVQYKNWWQFLWRTYAAGLDAMHALAVGRRLLNPLIVELHP